MSWFNDVFGFEESDYAETQARFFQEGPFLHTRSQPSVSYRSGILTMPSLAELRKAVSNLVTEPYGRCRFDGTVAKLAMRQPFVLFKGL
ncbi:hypothetical protein ACE15J_28155, partial [Klebsiella pneumoniae]